MPAPPLRRNEHLQASNSVGEPPVLTDVQAQLSNIVQACQQGELAAQRRLYDAFHQNVYRTMVRMVDAQDAADVTQQVFLQVFRKIGQYSGESQIGTWIYRVAVNEALQHLRKAKRLRMRPLKREPMDRSGNGNDRFDERQLLEHALAAIDPDLRTTFLLREVEGLSYADIAGALEIPIGTVGSRLNRARRDLKQRIADLGWEP